MPPPDRLYVALRLATAFGFALYSTVSVIRRVTVLGLDPLELALVGTTLELTVFLFEVPTGVVADLKGRRLSVAAGMVLVGLGFAIEAFGTSLAAVLLAQVGWGLGWTFVSGAREAWLADEVGEERAARAFVRAGRLTPLARLAGIAGAVGLGTLALHHPMRLAAVWLAALGVAAAFLPETGFAPRAREAGLGRVAATLRDGARAARTRPVVGLLFGVALFYGMASEGIDRLWEYHFLANFPFPAGGALPAVFWFGVLNALSLVLSLGLLTALERRLDPRDEARVARLLLWLHAGLALAVLGLAWAGSFAAAAAAMLLVTALRQAELPYTEAWLNRGLDPRSRATVLSLHGQCGALGEIGGGPLLGATARAAGARLALSGAALLLLPALALLAGARMRVRRRAPG